MTCLSQRARGESADEQQRRVQPDQQNAGLIHPVKSLLLVDLCWCGEMGRPQRIHAAFKAGSDKRRTRADEREQGRSEHPF